MKTPEKDFLKAYEATREWVKSADEAGLSLNQASYLYDTEDTFRSQVEELRSRWKLELRDKAMVRGFRPKGSATDIQRAASILGDNWNKLIIEGKVEHQISLGGKSLESGRDWLRTMIKDVTPRELSNG